MKRGMKFVMIALGVIVALAMLALLEPVSEKVGEVMNVASDKVRSTAQTVAGVGVGLLLVSWGIAALSVPWLGAVMIIVGLGMLAWNLFPLFKSRSLTNGK